MTFKNSIIKELEINPDIEYNEAKKRIEGLKEKTFNNVRTIWRKTQPKNQGKNGKNQGQAIFSSSTKKIDNKNLRGMNPEDLLILGMTKQIELDPALFNAYIKLGLYKRHQEKFTGEKYIYKRPDWLFPHQQQQIDMMHLGNMIIWGMRQLTGKSTAKLVGIFEHLILREDLTVYFISASKDLAKEILAKTHRDPLLAELYEQRTIAFLRESVEIDNGNSIRIRPCKPAAVQGITGAIWIDELDKILQEKDKAETFAAMLPIILRLWLDGKAWIWISCNQATGQAALAFEYFITVIKKLGNFFRVCQVIEPTIASRERQLAVLNDFDPDIPQDPFGREQWFINVIYEMQKAIAGEEFAAAQMKNIRLDRSGIWTREDVLEAFNSYDPKTVPNWDNTTKAGGCVDPGVVHGTGIVGGCRGLDGHIYIYLAEKRYGTEIPEEEFKKQMYHRYHEFHWDFLGSESNSGGLEWINSWVGMGLNAFAVNFGGENVMTGEVTAGTKAVERHYKERVLKYLFEKKMIHIIKSEELFRDFALYNPYENKVKGKGDIIDALLHFVFWIVGGLDFVVEILEQDTDIEKQESTILL